MKIQAFILIGIFAATAANAQTLLPKSSISIRVAETTTPPTPVGKKCKLGFENTEFAPSVILGTDSAGSAQLKLFALVQGGKEDTGVKLYPLLTQSISAGTKPLAASLSSERWACSCCRFLNKDKPKVVGWYAELEKDGRLLSKAQSSSSDQAAKAIQNRIVAKNTPALTVAANGTNISTARSGTFVFRRSEVARIIASTGEIADVQFTEISGSELAKYRWRYQAKPGAPVQEGSGQLNRSNPPSADDNRLLIMGNLIAMWEPQSSAPGAGIPYSKELAELQKLPSTAFGSPLVKLPTDDKATQGGFTTIKENQVVLLDSFGAKVMVQFTKVSDTTGYYRWKYQGSGSSEIETGEGQVQEEFSMQPQPDGTTKRIRPRNQDPVIEAGNLRLGWSMPSAGNGCISIPSYTTYEKLPAQAFERSFEEAPLTASIDTKAPARPFASEPTSGGTPKNHMKTWTSEEEETLREELKAGKSVAEIAAAHGRSHSAIIARIRKLGLSEPATP